MILVKKLLKIILLLVLATGLLYVVNDNFDLAKERRYVEIYIHSRDFIVD